MGQFQNLWGKISDYRKKNELSWEQSDLLKSGINTVFDALKAVRRIDHEKEDETSKYNFIVLEKKINDAVAKLIYPEEWPKLFDVFKAIQEEVKSFQLRMNHRRKLFDKLNEAFNDLRRYRKAEYVNRNKARIANLESAMRGITQSLEREKENYQQQFEKMMHYTRGKLSETEVAASLSHIQDRIREKEGKITNIRQTISSIVKQMEKEDKRDKKKEQEAQKEQGKKEKKESPAEVSPENEIEEIPVSEHEAAAIEEASETTPEEELAPATDADVPVSEEPVLESGEGTIEVADEVAASPEEEEK